MYEEERLQEICKYVQSNTRASVRRLCRVFDVSESTIRRDLTELEKRRMLKRTHGGAVCLESVGLEPTYVEKQDRYQAEKQRIAARAAELIEDGDSVLIDSGTTTLYLAPYLTKFKKLTVVTNSINLMQQLIACAGITLICVGGTLRPNTMALVGPIAEINLGRMRLDKAFIATNGMDAAMGLSTPNLLEAATKEKMIAVSEQVYVLADHSKIGRVFFARFGSAADMDGLVTSRMIPEGQKQELIRKGVRFYYADEPGRGPADEREV